MCRLFGFRSNDPGPVHRSLVLEHNSLVAQSRIHKDGWGLAYYDDGPVPLTAFGIDAAHADPEFERVTSHVASRCVLAHVRRAFIGPLTVRNCQPFLHGPWAFAHNGNVSDWVDHVDTVRSWVAPDLLALAKGQTDSEVLCYLFLTILRERHGAAALGTTGPGIDAASGLGVSGLDASGDAGSEDAGSGTTGSGTAGSGTAGSGTAGSGTAGFGTAGFGTAGFGTAGSGTTALLNVDAVAGALAETMHRIIELTRLHEEEDPTSITLMVTDGRLLVAGRKERGLFFSEKKPTAVEGPHPPPVGSRLEQLVIASEPLSQEDHWHELEEDELIGVDPELTLRRWPLASLVR